MLKILREKTKVILWIVVVAFVVTIFAAWGMNYSSGDSPGSSRTGDVVGMVNGDEITRSEYSNNLNRIFSQMRAQRGEDYSPSEVEINMLREQAWEMTVQEKLVAERIRKMNITVSDRELVSFIRNNPHPSLRSIFTDEEGNFIYQEYLNAISDPGRDWTELENWARATLPRYKLETLIAGRINISEKEILDEYKIENEEVKAKYSAVPFGSDTSYSPPENEIIDKYDEISDQFIRMEKRQVDLIEIKIEPTERDYQEVKDNILDIRAEIFESGDFGEAARNYSDDAATARKGGDLGFFEKGEMDPEFEKAAFSLNPGEISGPVKTGFGYHLIKAEERKTENGREMVRARHILMEVTPGYDTTDSLSSLVRDMRDNIKSKGFEKAAAQAGIEIKELPPFPRQGFLEGVGYAPRLSNFAFDHKKGKVSPPIEVKDSVYFVRIKDIIPESVKPLEEVRDLVVARIRKDRMKQAAHEEARELRNRALETSLDEAAEEAGLKAAVTPFFKKNESVDRFGASSVFVEACHMLPVKTLSNPLEGDNEYYLIIVMEKTKADMAKFSENRERLANELRSRKAQKIMAQWYADLKRNADIVDLRLSPIK